MLVRWNARPAPIDRWFDEVFGLGNLHNANLDRPLSPAVDISEDDTAYAIAIELPGVKSEDLKIEVDGNRLLVRGEKKQATEEKTDRVFRLERRYGSFERAFTLPETVDANAIEAKVADGVVTISVPKVAKALPRAIPIKAA